jgi:hypothetical protein
MPMALMIATIMAGCLPGPAALAQCDPQQVMKLLPGDAPYQSAFGYRIGISGTTAIIGAGSDGVHGGNSGSAYLFDLTTGTELFKLLPDDGAAGDGFGYAVAISGNMALVGAYGDDNGDYSGSVYLFDVATGTQIAKLLPDVGVGAMDFGYAVAISGTTALVGAPRAVDWEHLGGAVYMFDVTTGTQLGMFYPDDDAYDDYFGASLAVDGNTAIVGSIYDDDNGTNSGSAYLFDITTGAQLAKLLPTDGDSSDIFGHSVAIGGGTAVIGAVYDDDNGSASGSAYVFVTATGTQTAKLLAADGAAMDYFGCSVAVSGTTALVGAYGDATRTGAAYLFDGVSGAQLDKLVADDGGTQESFGSAVVLDGNMALIGAYLDTDNNFSGSAYIFDTNCPDPLTIGAQYTCLPASGTLPFSSTMTVNLDNQYAEQARRVAARIDVTLANGQFYANWMAGFTNIAAGGSFTTSWSANILPNLSMVGDNIFLLVAEDVTPAPWNQPPYPPAGDTATASCTVTGLAP